MPDYNINNIPVNFPFEPYDVQKAYMSKVIDCLNNGTHGVLESPTGTGKTLSLLCSTLAWVSMQKAQYQLASLEKEKSVKVENFLKGKFQGNTQFNSENPTITWGIPKVIYSSRTHSQLNQAMQELKRTSYSYMKAVVIGSRDQLCIHPEVSKETLNSIKIQMCKLHVTTRSCSFYNNVDKNKDHELFTSQNVVDIEDLISIGKKLKMCPYYASKERIQDADIVFMPYNYLLDPKARKANKIELKNAIVILDEAHNIEKICEDAASVQIKSSDIALCIEEVTYAMRIMSAGNLADTDDESKDFTVDDLALLKEILLELEKAIDEIEVINKVEGMTYSAEFIFNLLAKAKINLENYAALSQLLDNLIQYLTVAGNESSSAFKKGTGLQKFSDFVTIVFIGSGEQMREKVLTSFKVHVEIEEMKTQKSSVKKDGWVITKGATVTKQAKVINYWCFSPNFGMEQILQEQVRSIILTSGTLAPLQPLIAELGIPISNRLENPHIVDKSQVCVKIVSNGPDNELLISNFKNRDNPKYINSLGRTILSFCPVIPDGLLVFFPSYPLMNKCKDSWQASGIWSQICRHKPIFVESRDRESFTTIMNEFYSKIQDPKTKGACFMAVCRGKVSEGLDFADINGRAVIITGLPFPPLMDPRVILKRKYLDNNRTKENGLLSGENWYGLEATRAVNQAIGRVIRHKNDYGAIILCDSRFNLQNQKSQLSSWIQDHLKTSPQYPHFGPYVRDIATFFRNAEKTVSQSCVTEIKQSPLTPLKIGLNLGNGSSSKISEERKPNTSNTQAFLNKIEKTNTIHKWTAEEYIAAAGNKKTKVPDAMDFVTRLSKDVTTIDFNSISESSSPSLETVQKRERKEISSPPSTNSGALKKKKLKIVGNWGGTESSASSSSSSSNSSLAVNSAPVDRVELVKLIKNSIPSHLYKMFLDATTKYHDHYKIDEFCQVLLIVFHHPALHYLLRAMRRFVHNNHKEYFDKEVEKHCNK